MLKGDQRAFLKDGHTARIIFRVSEVPNIAHGHTFN